MTRDCLVCGQEFRFRGEKRKLVAKFCSVACRSINDKGREAWNKGLFGYKTKPCSEERKRKIGVANSIALKGKKHSLETRLKMSASAKKGSDNSAWKGGVTPLHRAQRKSVEYSIWREAVFERDGWSCVTCKKRGCYLQADHIKPFSLFPDLRFEIDNGRTLCKGCHKEVTKIQHKDKIFTKSVATRFKKRSAEPQLAAV